MGYDMYLFAACLGAYFLYSFKKLFTAARYVFSGLVIAVEYFRPVLRKLVGYSALVIKISKVSEKYSVDK